MYKRQTRQRVICLTPHALLTTEKIVPFCQHPGTAPGVDVAQKIVKLAVFCLLYTSPPHTQVRWSFCVQKALVSKALEILHKNDENSL